ncbi:MAG TPA: 16S rRNA (guanine(966)-N(2))-methyltransferase RsmD [Caldilineae bacterium]|nr:16S rRNA (guanine(966)-N(2))-methyltransferase RsmD [Caldilineae bacterium]
MRVIAGSAKGRRLESVPGKGTRPITDRAKEALFNILGNDIVAARVLDLFGGTGAVGIEALSRGAAEAVFVERSGKALKIIGHNLQNTRLAEQAQVIRGDAFKVLQWPDLAPFDLIYVAPPQYEGLWLQALALLDARPELLTPDGEVIVQIHPKEYEKPALEHLERVDSRRYGSVQLDFYRRRER